MIVYVDILILVNSIINYYILILTTKINKTQYKNFRLIISAFIGSFFSFFIFLPQQNIIIEIIFKIFSSFCLVLIAFGYKKIKTFLRSLFIMFSTSFIFAGAMLAIWVLFKPNGLIINNSVVYFNISPVLLVAFSVIFYIVFTVLNSVLQRTAKTATRCNVKITLNQKNESFIGIFDSGNSVKDIFGNSEIIFIGENSGKKLFGNISNISNDYKSRYRVLPCSTITGSKLLEAVRCDKAEIFCDNNKITLNKPIVALSKNVNEDEYNVILNPEILVLLGD